MQACRRGGFGRSCTAVEIGRGRNVDIQRIGDARYQLGESPQWDAVEDVLYWVDSLAVTMFRLDPSSGRIVSWNLPGDYLGSMALREGGGAVVAMDAGFHLFDFASGACTAIAAPEAGVAANRFNDGKVDRRGRFVAGSMNREEAEPTGALYRLDPDHSWTKLDEGFACSNGPCWSRDGRILYFADSIDQVIYAYDYDPDTGAVANRRVFVSTAEIGGHPDGATVDSEGYVWSAQFGAGCLRRFAPDGTLDRTVELPVSWVASVTFGGADLDVLYVTSIGGSIGDDSDASPQAGGLFAIHGLGVKGLPEPRFKG
jgi:sugar lactone lactonase YvrE